MKSLKKAIALACIGAGMLVSTLDAAAWGAKGHDITCSIAEKHLSRKARKAVDRIFEGKSMVYWSSWMDNASHTPELSYTSTWHYKNIDADEEYDTAVLNENGDVVTALNAQIAALKSGTLNPEAEALALKMVVHLMGDLHCPMHMAHKSDRGGNRWQIQYFNNGKNLHSIWDSDLIESAHKWTFSEWTDQIDRVDRKTIKAIQEGNPYEWGRETFATTIGVYDATPVGSKLSYDYVEYARPILEQQLLRGGLRLAAVLNEIFK